MQVTACAPSADLAPFVRRFVIVESGDEATRTLLPDPGVLLGLRFAGASSLVTDAGAQRVADAAITGVLRTARRMRTAPRSGVVVTAFHATGAAAFFAMPVHELAGAMHALDALVGRADAQRVEGQLRAATDHPQRIAVVEQFLRARLCRERRDALVEAAVSAIRTSRGALRIADLARALGISQDPLEKRFRRTVGASPKHFASILRLGHVVDAHRWFAATPRAPHADWARRAIDAGYFDQSHFIRAFRAVTGDAPERFFRAGEYC